MSESFAVSFKRLFTIREQQEPYSDYDLRVDSPEKHIDFFPTRLIS